MKRIGIIGGMSFESTLHYYEQINRQVNEQAGGLTSADIVLRSVNFGEYCELMKSGDWNEIARKLSTEALDLVLLNKCDYVAIATNTMHKVADKVEGPHAVSDNIWPPTTSYVGVPLIHIGDCVAEECVAKGFNRVAIIGTKMTMTDDFMKNRLGRYGLEVVGGFEDSEIQEIDRIIFEELCHGKTEWKSHEKILNILMEVEIRDKKSGGRGFDAAILGCTELRMLYGDFPGIKNHFAILDSTKVHIDRLADLCLS